MFQCVKFAELPVEDQDRALAFYTDKLGMEVAQDSRYGEDWRWIELRIPRARTLILMTRKNEAASRDTPRLVLTVDDVARTHEELTRRGVTFTKEPAAAPWDPAHSYALFKDSEGNVIMIGS